MKAAGGGREKPELLEVFHRFFTGPGSKRPFLPGFHGERGWENAVCPGDNQKCPGERGKFPRVGPKTPGDGGPIPGKMKNSPGKMASSLGNFGKARGKTGASPGRMGNSGGGKGIRARKSRPVSRAAGVSDRRFSYWTQTMEKEPFEVLAVVGVFSPGAVKLKVPTAVLAALLTVTVSVPLVPV